MVLCGIRIPDFHKRILFSDEAHFWLNGYVNKQNCRIWSEANPQVYVETPLHPEKLTVCCALWAGGIFLKNDEDHNVTVNGDRYRAMITNFFIPELNNHDVQELWFQQDGATCHTARATIDLLKDTFGDRLISRFGPVNWPPRSCELTPLDYFLWGYVKSLVYADKPQTLDHLEDNIRRVIADIRPQMLEKVIENWTSRLDYIRASRCSPMPEIIFKMFKHRSPSQYGGYDPRLVNRVDGSRSDTGKAGSGIFSNTPGNDVKISIRNPYHCSVFRSELIAISGALDHAFNSYKDSIWILTDSRSSIKYLKNWPKIMDSTGLDILSKLARLGQRKQVCL
ncbi:DDE_3 domain-containing protein [Trichonephila clavipes]|nr:DDE_3 domain-containing protein [Trichonephila clavipes]